MFYYDDDDFFFRKIVFSNRSRTLIEAAPEKNWFDFTIEAAAYKRHNTVIKGSSMQIIFSSTTTTEYNHVVAIRLASESIQHFCHIGNKIITFFHV